MPNNERHWTDDQLAAAWVGRYGARPRIVLSLGEPDQQIASSESVKVNTRWALDALDSLITDDPYAAWRIILMIQSIADGDEVVLANLAAGPLERLLASHGRKAVVWVEHEAQRNSEFKRLLGSVWQNLMPELIWQRVQKAASD